MQDYQVNLSPFAGEIKQMGNLQFMGLFSKVQFIEEKLSGKIAWREQRIKGLIDHLQTHDKLILPELSRLGRFSLEIMEKHQEEIVALLKVGSR